MKIPLGFYRKKLTRGHDEIPPDQMYFVGYCMAL